MYSAGLCACVCVSNVITRDVERESCVTLSSQRSVVTLLLSFLIVPNSPCLNGFEAGETVDTAVFTTTNTLYALITMLITFIVNIWSDEC